MTRQRRYPPTDAGFYPWVPLYKGIANGYIGPFKTHGESWLATLFITNDVAEAAPESVYSKVYPRYSPTGSHATVSGLYEAGELRAYMVDYIENYGLNALRTGVLPRGQGEVPLYLGTGPNCVRPPSNNVFYEAYAALNPNDEDSLVNMSLDTIVRKYGPTIPTYPATERVRIGILTAQRALSDLAAMSKGSAARPNPGLADAIAEVFADLLMLAPPDAFPDGVRLVLDDATALAGRTAYRACAACDETTVYVSERLLGWDSERQAGVLAHELGHVYLMQNGITEAARHDHSERDADAVAFEVLGVVVRYDADDIQTTSPDGVTPRPRRLDAKKNPSTGAGGRGSHRSGGC